VGWHISNSSASQWGDSHFESQPAAVILTGLGVS
jgi:hypothetical protein